ncbi:MAG: erythromycin esterase family protein [Thermoguttaceae bacterium]|jgi:erythromycin esterase-like protein|nr:erythromycin esterase family protein [Thermoguttaceae bacterium]
MMETRLLPLLLGVLLPLAACAQPATSDVLEAFWVEFFREHAHRLEDPGDLDPLLNAIGDSRLVLLGESTHGTSEYYRWRDKISRRLISEKGFSFVAVEGDWESLYQLNKYVKLLPGAMDDPEAILRRLDRWPPWMWANREVLELARWMRAHNEKLPPHRRCGFYGIDLYGWGDSVRRLPVYFDRIAPGSRDRVRKTLEPLERLDGDMRAFHVAVHQQDLDAGAAVDELAAELKRNEREYRQRDELAYFAALQSVKVVREAKRHMRTSGAPGGASWNIRATHFKDTVQRLLDFYGEGAKGIAWAHNTHVGDARATDMGRVGLVNIGRLARERMGNDEVFIVGFATYEGEVFAGRGWGQPRAQMQMPPAREGSFEHYLRQAGHPRALYILRGMEGDELLLMQIGLQRAVGVVYQPERDQVANFVPTILPERYDALLYFETTSPLQALHD